MVAHAPGVHFNYGRYGQFRFDFDDLVIDGKVRCRFCKGPITEKRRKFYCGKKCSKDFSIHVIPTGWSTIRDRAIARDGARCTLCKDGPMSEADLADKAEADRLWELYRVERTEENRKRCKAIWDRRAQRDLEVDHIKPVARYPMQEFDLDNVRTLCRACHLRHGARPPPRLTSQNRRLEAA